MSEFEMDGNPDDLITASEVAKIWNKRAKAMGYDRRYTRRSVNVRRETRKTARANILKPAQETPLGNLYRREDAWKHPIQPQIGRPPGLKTEPKLKAVKPAA